MYSKVKVLGHPIHPMLVGFPVAFYTGTLVAFIVYSATMNVFWFRLACVANWAGVVMAAVAALPGLLDWSGIPRGSAANRTGLLHMGLNVTALVLFLINAVMASNRWNEALPPADTGIALSALGVLLTLPAGFLGWSMVQNHHVGVQLSREQERLEPVNKDPSSRHEAGPRAPMTAP